MALRSGSNCRLGGGEVRRGLMLVGLPIDPRNQYVSAAEHQCSQVFVPAVQDGEAVACPLASWARPRLGGSTCQAAAHCSLHVTYRHSIAASEDDALYRHIAGDDLCPFRDGHTSIFRQVEEFDHLDARTLAYAMACNRCRLLEIHRTPKCARWGREGLASSIRPAAARLCDGYARP